MTMLKHLPIILLAICLFTSNVANAQDLVPLSIINAGGEAVDTWTGDTDATPDPNLLAGSANIETIRGTPTVDASVPAEIPLAIFETMRIDANQPEPYMEWNFASSSYATYEVRLFFIEMSRCSVGSRVFDVEINGELVEDDLDVYAAAGNQCDVGFMRTYIVETFGGIDIRFPLVNGKPSTVAGIQVFGYGFPPIEYFAGTGEGSFNGDGMPALETNVSPEDVAINQAGDVYFVDDLVRVRVVDHATSIVTTVLDPAPDPNAGFIQYEGIAFDTSDNLYFSVIEGDFSDPLFQTELHYVKKLDTLTGEVTIIAGNGESGFDGDGGPATEAQLYAPSAIHLDAEDNLFVTTGDVIRRIDGTTGIIETIAGNGSRGFSGDGGPATDAMLHLPSFTTTDHDGNLLISDTYNHRVRKVNLSTGIIETIAGIEPAPSSMDNPGGGGYSGDGGPAIEAELRLPRGLAFDPEGNLIFSDSANNRLRTINKDTGIISSLTSPHDNASGFGIEMHGTDLYIARYGEYILKYLFDSSISNLSTSISTIDFGYVPLNSQSAPVTIDLINSGPTDIDITSVVVDYTTGDHFLISDIPATVPGNSSVQFDATFAPVPVPTAPAPKLDGTTVYRINAGGDALTDVDGNWSDDTAINPSPYLAAGTANIETDHVTPALDASVPAGTPLALFSSKRLDADKNAPNMSWSFPVTTGEEYEVNLFFVEMSRCSVGNRVFQVNIENQTVLSSFDVFAEAGGCNIGIMRSFTVEAEDDELDVTFFLINSKPTTLAGIEIIQVGDGGPTTMSLSGLLRIEHTGQNEIATTVFQGTTDIDDGSFNNPPVAAFDTSSTFLTVDFTDNSTDADGTIVSWDWDFGDGNTSTEQSPAHTYTAAGTYEIALTVTDNEGATATASVTMLVQAPPVPDGLMVSLPVMQASAGASGLIPLTASDLTGEGLTSYDFTLTYDATVLAITGADTTGTLSQILAPVVNVVTPGVAIVAWAGALPLEGSGTLLNLTADFLTEGTSSITFTDFMFNEGALDVTTTDGSIEVVASSGSGAFVATDSLVVMEAENAQVNLEKNNQIWEAATSQAGFSGASYMVSTPDVGEIYKGDELDMSPELQFEVEFQEAGQYNFWARMAALSKKGDSMHIGVNGVKHETQSTVSVAFDGDWHWSTAFDNTDQMAFDIPTPGTYTINVWVREDGLLFDKILFIRDPAYVPTGEGPAESPQAVNPVIAKANGADDLFMLPGTQQALPEEFALKGNYPNPFNPTTTIQFELPEATDVRLEVFDMMGRRVALLVDNAFVAGRHEVQWHATTDAGTRVASGVYLYRLRAGNFEMTRRMALMK